MLIRLLSCVLLFAAIVSVRSSVCAEEPLSFTRDVRPILSGRCYKCHGPDEETREAGFRLDLFDGAIAELESGGHGIVPGNAEKSSVLARINTDDEFDVMPPTSEGEGLTAAEKKILRQWIVSGAKYEQHWSFLPPQKSKLPEVSNPDWCKNGIDYFVQKRLDELDLKPAPQADRTALIRRVSIDLTGIPPTLEEVDAFVNDTSPDAYEKVVDRLLASERYGERWARIWLDLARYADSAGYADDPPRTIWRYRDWVIRSLNEDMPFDQFTVEQLAGDMLESPTDDQLTATGFHRNTMTNSEGGTDDEEFRSAAIVDRVNTTMQVWMGLTMGCAQCHTHKYDPILHSEYYQVYDIFNQTEDADRRDESPLLKVLLPAQKDLKAKLEKQLVAAKAEQAAVVAAAAQAGTSIELPTGDIEAQFVRIELPGKKKMLSLAEVQAFAGKDNVAVKGKATQSSTDYNGPPQLANDGNTDGHFYDAMSTTHTKQSDDPWWEVDLGKQQRLDKIIVWNRNDSPGIGVRLNGMRLILLDAQRKPVWVKEVAKTTEKDNPVAVPKLAKDFSDDERKAFQALSANSNPKIDAAKKKVASLEQQIKKIQPVTSPIMRELAMDKHRSTRIHIRGNFLDLGDEVHAGVPSALHAIDVEKPNRLDFAKWLMAGENPLTARVIANRHWEALFGIGIVQTSEDFGMQGELPSHPKLLDWLAIELMENNWSLKQYIRTVVTSATYQQDSAMTAELIEQDPKNQLLARGPRFRLSAEMIRDQALAVSGLLSSKMYGESVRPPRPNLGLRAAFGGSTDWSTSTGEDKYRRGVYTQWRRSIPYPSMDTFDAPSREVCTVRRIRTNTPLQALVTLNDPVYIEAARGLAGRVLNDGGDTIDERLNYAFRLCTSRTPNAREMSILKETLLDAKSSFENEAEEAKALSAMNMNEGTNVPVPEQAAWTVLGNVLLNLDEMLTRR